LKDIRLGANLFIANYTTLEFVLISPYFSSVDFISLRFFRKWNNCISLKRRMFLSFARRLKMLTNSSAGKVLIPPANFLSRIPRRIRFKESGFMSSRLSLILSTKSRNFLLSQRLLILLIVSSLFERLSPFIFYLWLLKMTLNFRSLSIE